jgi:uncharacterized protein (TIGR02284 family)
MLFKRKPDPNPANQDPITLEPGAHPVGTGVGAAVGGAAVGAAAGAIAGPVGAVLGAVVGAAFGGETGKAAAESLHPTHDEGDVLAVAAGLRRDAAGNSLSRMFARLGGAPGAIGEQAPAVAPEAQAPANLDPPSARALDGLFNDLEEASRDAQRGFADLAGWAYEPVLRELIERRSGECGEASDAFRQLVNAQDGRAAVGGTLLGKVRRDWMKLTEKESPRDDKELMELCDRIEDHSLEQYRDALNTPLPADALAVVMRHAKRTLDGHEQFTAMIRNFRFIKPKPM